VIDDESGPLRIPVAGVTVTGHHPEGGVRALGAPLFGDHFRHAV
jgi:hypothetical protein